ncbi:hypothetical protein TNIN_31041 [Trichonephila inaurata madagascariensis]|uniref:Uncharacterized protein n=1 Tax=Trichonephila inaurata madagascariensis TaxID=2747483 RepID=A0A8X7BNT6_9ARAC|nr:hypothetical protein TNIN_31041 [Trichonephila inaurata madagascariensis]
MIVSVFSTTKADLESFLFFSFGSVRHFVKHCLLDFELVCLSIGSEYHLLVVGRKDMLSALLCLWKCEQKMVFSNFSLSNLVPYASVIRILLKCAEVFRLPP